MPTLWEYKHLYDVVILHFYDIDEVKHLANAVYSYLQAFRKLHLDDDAPGGARNPEAAQEAKVEETQHAQSLAPLVNLGQFQNRLFPFPANTYVNVSPKETIKRDKVDSVLKLAQFGLVFGWKISTSASVHGLVGIEGNTSDWREDKLTQTPIYYI